MSTDPTKPAQKASSTKPKADKPKADKPKAAAADTTSPTSAPASTTDPKQPVATAPAVPLGNAPAPAEGAAFTPSPVADASGDEVAKAGAVLAHADPNSAEAQPTPPPAPTTPDEEPANPKAPASVQALAQAITNAVNTTGLQPVAEKPTTLPEEGLHKNGVYHQEVFVGTPGQSDEVANARAILAKHGEQE